MLTNATVKAAAARARPYKLADAGGLYLLVRPNGSKVFRMKYRKGRKEKLLTFGSPPELALVDARAMRDRAREQLRNNIDPAAAPAPASSGGMTFEQLARDWLERRQPRWSAKHAADVEGSLERDVFPSIGAKAPADIDAAAVLELLLAIEDRGHIETALRVRERIAGIFRRGITLKLCKENPADQVADELSPRPVKRPQPALLVVEQLRGLLADADRAIGARIAKLASRFLSLTLVRLDALRRADWVEIEDLDGPAPLWRIPPARMKLTRVRKADPAAEHVVTLSRQAVAILLELRRLTGGTGLIFPGRRAGKPIGEGAIGDLYDRAGYAGRHVPHGWRASFSTIMNELAKLQGREGERALIDRALAHTPKDKVEAAYNRAEHLVLTRDLFQRWADLIAPQLPALPPPDSSTR